MPKFNIAEAKTHFSELIQKAMLGEEIIIAKDNKAVAKLVPINVGRQPRVAGSAKGRIWFAPDFDDTPEDFEDYK